MVLSENWSTGFLGSFVSIISLALRLINENKVLLFILITVTLFFGAIVASAWNLTDPRVVEDYVLYKAHQEGVPAQLAWDIAKCESGFNPLAHNISDPDGGSKGVFQFQSKTFYKFAKEYEIENPDIWNSVQQIQIAIRMLANGLAFHWTCAKTYGHV